MSRSDDVPYFSRFLTKFLEIFAAGLATAVSGYLIAHLAGALSSPTPAPVGTAIQVAPNAGAVSSGPPVKSPPAPVSADTSEQHAAPVQEASAPADARPAQGTEPAHADPAKAVVAPKHSETDKHLETDKHSETTSAAASAAESKRDQQENKRAQDAVLARIRAALANNNAKRINPSDRPQPQGNGPRPTATIGSQSPSVDDRPAAASGTSASPNSAKAAPPPAQQQVQQPVQLPVQQPPSEPTPLTTVEIPSRPVANVQTAPASAPTSQDDTGMFSGLDRLRHDPLAASEEAPRPPMPVGQ
jgi:hypothetical protein